MKATIRIETMVIPTYPEPAKEEMPLFAEHRVHQRSTGRPYPNKVTLEVDREHRADQSYTVVHLENEYLDVLVLPQIGGRVFAARDKKTDYDFFYRQHVIKPGLIGALGSWISGGVEFNWPYHHRPSGFMPCDYETEECPDGSVICWLSEHEPIDRMKGMVGIVLRPDAAYLETRVRLCNRTDTTRSFLWWENTAVPVNESYQIFFPRDVSYVNFHYLDSRISYPIAGDASFNGIDMRQARDISWHKNTRDATSYFACASKYDFFGGYDHGKDCGVVHIGDHHVSPGKKMFTWAYSQLAKTWENTLTDTDGQYAELMAGSYTDNQPNFSWLEPYETRCFSQFWYPIQKIGTPDYANLDCAVTFGADTLWLQSTGSFGDAHVVVTQGQETVLDTTVELKAGEPVSIPWHRPEGMLGITVTAGKRVIVSYQEEPIDQLKKPPVKDGMPLASEVASADELYLAGVHVEQYRDPAVMPDAYWLEALKRNPYHAPSLLAMAKYCYQMARLEEAEDYARKALAALTKFNMHTQSGDPYFLLAQILEAKGELEEAYDHYYKASWNGSAVSKAMARLACLDMRKGDWTAALDHARRSLKRDADHPLAQVCLALTLKALGQEEEAAAVIAQGLENDRFHMLLRWLSPMDKAYFFGKLDSEPAQTVLDMVFDLVTMGQNALAIELLEELGQYRGHTAMTHYTLAWLKNDPDTRPGDEAPLGNTYPARLREIPVLEHAMANGSHRAPFLLGCLLYDKRQYERAAQLFAESVRLEPDNYMTHRCLAIAWFSHLNRKEEAMKELAVARSLSCTQQLLYESVVAMDILGASPEEKLALLTPHVHDFRRDDLFVELAKAYNQAGQPEKALETLASHVFVACEGGEHAIADQYMYAHYQIGKKQMAAKDFAAAYQTFENAQHFPARLGAGIWNRCKLVPYQFAMAQCLEELDRREEALDIYREILDIEVEFFSNAHLQELPWYQAMCAEKLGLPQRAWNLMGKCKREWTKELTRVDDGFFSTTPFFVSFIQEPAVLRSAHYRYLLGLVALYEGKQDEAKALFRQSYAENSDNLFCHWFAHSLT